MAHQADAQRAVVARADSRSAGKGRHQGARAERLQHHQRGHERRAAAELPPSQL